MTISIDGTLEIDQHRGVIYFHANEGYTLLRICSLPKPIPAPIVQDEEGLVLSPGNARYNPHAGM